MITKIEYVRSPYIEQRIKIKHLIPYRVNHNCKYEVNKMYYNEYWSGCFTVQKAKYDRYGILEEVQVKWDDGNFGLMCTDLDLNDYILERDKNKIYKRSHIINDGKVYTGAEIVYWFYIHNITAMNPKYKGFWKFIDPTSQHRIADFNKYMISAEYDMEQDVYYCCRVIRQR